MTRVKDAGERASVIAENGTYAGYRNADGICRFLGIPFGRARRWERAQDVETTTEDVVWADRCGPAPWQEHSGLSVPVSEDCLNLNLYVRNMEQSGKAVLVWIYGGAQVAGSNIGPDAGGEPLLDAGRIVEENPDILVVVPNYRVGVWGSLNLSVLDGYNETYRSGSNLARLDIVQCLKWVRRNIAAFGGDCEKVTLAGQSAGSANISSLLLMKEAKGLFRRVICESSFAMDLSLTSEKESAAVAKAYFKSLGVHTMEQALSLPDEALLAAQEKLTGVSAGGSPAVSGTVSKLFSPVVDGAVITEDYWDYLMHEGCRRVDFMGGTNEGEYDRQFEPFSKSGDEAAALQMLLDHCRGKLRPECGGDDRLLQKYLEQRKDTNRLTAYQDLKNDLYLRIGAVCYAIAFAQAGSRSYCYYLTARGKTDAALKRRCRHGDEIPVLFGKTNPIEKDVQKRIRRAWFDFVRSGNPDRSGGWRQVSGGILYTMDIGKEMRLMPGIRMEDVRLLVPRMKEYVQFPAFASACRSYLDV